MVVVKFKESESKLNFFNCRVHLVLNICRSYISMWCAACLVCYIKCKQLRPRVDVEIVGGGGSGQARLGRLCRSRSQAGLGCAWSLASEGPGLQNV